MTFPLQELPKTQRLYVKLRQYPILGEEIRVRMREELFRRGIISEERFEIEVEEKAIASQQLEGLQDPYGQEPHERWQERLSHVRDHLTEFYFAYNLPIDVFDQIVSDLLEARMGQKPDPLQLAYSRESAPLDVLIRDGEAIEALPPEERAPLEHHLQELRVVIIKTIISDQLEFVGIAKKWLTVRDLRHIRERRFGRGKIGGKAAGILLAWKIVQHDPALAEYVGIPESYFLGTDVFSHFKRDNNLTHVRNQKYKPSDVIRAEYGDICAAFEAGKLPEYVRASLHTLLEDIGRTPLIVRSSSLLEDSFRHSFAGKYDSFFCPNQGSVDENLAFLTSAISRIYASVYSPDALLYRQRMGLLDYDERMAILIQIVEGERSGDFYYPPIAGVAFSRNPYRWTPRIKREDGLLRIVCGLGTRAVDPTGDDYTRLVALSHPTLRPEVDARSIRRYSQHHIDVLNMQTNQFETRPITEVLTPQLPWLRLAASREKDGHIQKLFMVNPGMSPDELVMTFDQLLEDARFIGRMKRVLKKLAQHYGVPVDIEFTAGIDHTQTAAAGQPEVKLRLVQCRPQSTRAAGPAVAVPQHVPDADRLFTTRGFVPEGKVDHINFVVFVPPKRYDAISDHATKHTLARVIGRLNYALEAEQFIVMGPNRWGSNDPEQGVKVTYADIHNTAMLVELAYATAQGTPEPSYGTHFFQDLVEAGIYSLAVYPDRDGGFFDEAFFLDAPNLLSQLSPQDAELEEYVRVVNVSAASHGRTLTVVMDADTEEAVGYLETH
ncbi:MAG: PEP/pyruvate-binding domain-containing protein [Anaerolineales bacterium]